MRKYMSKTHVIDIPGFECEVRLKPKGRAKRVNMRRNIITRKAAKTPPVPNPPVPPRMMQAQAASSAAGHWIYVYPPGIWHRIS